MFQYVRGAVTLTIHTTLVRRQGSADMAVITNPDILIEPVLRIMT